MTDFFAAAVYLLCLVTSVGCAWLLGRSYSRMRMRLLLWASICFAFLALNNLALVLDILVLPAVDLRLLRLLPSFAAAGCLIWGFIWEVEQE